MANQQVRVDPVLESSDPDAIATFRLLEANTGIGNLHRAIANSPAVFRNFIGLSHALRNTTLLDPIERELAICCVLERHRGEYELDAHRRYALAIGASEDQIKNVGNRDASGIYSERLRQILLFAEHMAASPQDRTRLPAHEIEAWLDNRERIELGLTLAVYMGLAHFTENFAVPREDFDSAAGKVLQSAITAAGKTD